MICLNWILICWLNFGLYTFGFGRFEFGICLCIPGVTACHPIPWLGCDNRMAFGFRCIARHSFLNRFAEVAFVPWVDALCSPRIQHLSLSWVAAPRTLEVWALWWEQSALRTVWSKKSLTPTRNLWLFSETQTFEKATIQFLHCMLQEEYSTPVIERSSRICKSLENRLLQIDLYFFDSGVDFSLLWG